MEHVGAEYPYQRIQIFLSTEQEVPSVDLIQVDALAQVIKVLA